MGMVEKLKLKEGKFIDITVGTSELAMRVPSTREIIRLESRNTTIDGNVDIVKYIEDICEFIVPKKGINDLCEVPNEIEINLGEKNIILKGITAKKALSIVSDSAKVEKDPKDETNIILRPNTEGMLDAILSLAEEKIDINELKYKEVMQIPNIFQEKIEVSTLIEVYNIFQENFQA